VSFVWPFMLIALVAIPVLIVWYARQQRARAGAAAAFVVPALTPSVAPKRPGWRRHLPVLAFVLALAALIVAAARPQDTVAVPVNGAAIMLANDVSSSMSATDIKPSRLAAAQAASKRFVAGAPSSVQIGLMEFARRPILLQTPTTNRAEIQTAIAQLKPGGGGTAIGDTIQTAMRVLSNLRKNGKRLPSAIVLLSDGTSNVGTSPIAAAQQAKRLHIPIYTISLGTANGAIAIKRHGRTVNVPVAVSPQELATIASQSGGRTFTAADSARASAVYAHLATQLGHKQVKRELTARIVSGGLVLVLIGIALSLFLFARLA
jgi:Ca-activated chloride channel family protein